MPRLDDMSCLTCYWGDLFDGRLYCSFEPYLTVQGSGAQRRWVLVYGEAPQGRYADIECSRWRPMNYRDHRVYRPC